MLRISSNHQATSYKQISSLKLQILNVWNLAIGNWKLFGAWNLYLGALSERRERK